MIMMGTGKIRHEIFIIYLHAGMKINTGLKKKLWYSMFLVL